MFQFGTSDDKTAALKRVPMFAHLSDRELTRLSTEMDEVAVDCDTVLTHQGRPGHTFYVLLDGEVDVLIDGDRRTKLGPSSFFGEVSMLERAPATATVVTTLPSRLLVMSHIQFRDAVKARPALDQEVRSVMSDRLESNRLAAIKPRRASVKRRLAAS